MTFPLGGDETHFWFNTVEFFGRSPVPSVTALRSYPELNTPLPFVVWGSLEYWFHLGPWLPRTLNLLLSFAVTLLVAWPRDAQSQRRSLAAAGLLACPYYLFVSARVYTDMPAIFLSVFGLWAHTRQRHVWSAAFFALAIACRQYAVAFPLAIVAFGLWRGARASRAALTGSSLAVVSLAGWLLFFGGVAPPAAIDEQHIATAHLVAVIPQNALYMLSCVGLYFALPRLVLFGPLWRPLKLPSARLVAAAAAVVALFALFPPTGNQNVPTMTMGLFDRMLHAGGLPPAGRAAALCAFAIGAVVSVWRNPLALSLTASNALVMLKGHEAWDKYALPLLAALWLLASRELVSSTPSSQ